MHQVHLILIMMDNSFWSVFVIWTSFLYLEVDSILEPFASEHAVRVVKVDKVGEASLITKI